MINSILYPGRERWSSSAHPYRSTSSRACLAWTFLMSFRSALVPTSTTSGLSQYALACSWPDASHRRSSERDLAEETRERDRLTHPVPDVHEALLVGQVEHQQEAHCVSEERRGEAAEPANTVSSEERGLASLAFLILGFQNSHETDEDPRLTSAPAGATNSLSKLA